MLEWIEHFTDKITNLKDGITTFLNQITNIGVDTDSAHGGVSMDMVMKRRFCEIKSQQLTFPLVSPDKKKIDEKFERQTTRIVVPPLRIRSRTYLTKVTRRMFSIPRGVSCKEWLKEQCKVKRRR